MAEALERAAILSERWDVAGIDALLAAGLADEDVVYRALAAELDVPYWPDDVPVHPLARPAEAVAHGLVPLAAPDGAPARFAYAPPAARIEALLASRQLSAAVVMTRPTALREAVIRVRGATIAREAAESLPRHRPDDSYLGGVTLGQIVFAMVLCLVAGGVIAEAGLAGTVVALLLLSCPFLGLTAIRLAAATVAAPIRTRTFAIPDSDLPIYTVLIPVYREGRVLPKLIGALSALDYPAAKLDAKLLVEAGDHETRDALAAMTLPAFLQVMLIPPGAPQTKPRALNAALPFARGEYLVVFDAEDVPEPGQLRDAVAIFRRSPPDVACLQARLVIDNSADGWLQRLFTLEYGALFDVLNPALARFDLPLPLGGTSNHLRTAVLRDVGGWDAWNVTEYADLAVRLAAAGFRIADLPSSTLEEAPPTLRAWHAQRARWMKGFLQVTVTHSRRPLRLLGRLGFARMLGAAAIVAGTVVSALAYPILTGIALVELLSGRLLAAEGPLGIAVAGIAVTLLVSGAAAIVVPPALAIRRRGWWSLVPALPLMPLYVVLISTGAWRGLWEFVTDPQRWNKTEHGFARSSRAAAARADAGSPPLPARAAGQG